MKNKILIFIIGVLVGAIIATAGFLIYEKTNTNKMPNREMTEERMNHRNGEFPSDRPDGENGEEPPVKPEDSNSNNVT